MYDYFELIRDAAKYLDLEMSIFRPSDIKEYLFDKYPELKGKDSTINSIIQAMTYNSGSKRKLSPEKRILKRIDHGVYMLYIN